MRTSNKRALHKFKIHGAETVLGQSRDANTPKFYDTRDDAIMAAENCVTKNGCSIVVFEAVCVVHPERPPITITGLTDEIESQFSTDQGHPRQ